MGSQRVRRNWVTFTYVQKVAKEHKEAISWVEWVLYKIWIYRVFIIGSVGSVCVCVCVLGKEVIMLECKFITLGLCMLWVVQVIFSWFKQKYSGILFPARKVFEKSQSIIILVIYLDHYQYFLHLKKSVTGRHFITFLFFFFFFEAFQMLETQETLGSRKLRSSAAFTPNCPHP